MKNNLSLTVLTTLLVSMNSYAQPNSSLDVKAKINSGCFLEADNINFGILMTPIADQSSLSNMMVLCSKNTQLTIAIDYSNKNTSGTGQLTAEKHFIFGPESITYVLKENNKYISNQHTTTYGYDIWCHKTLGVAFKTLEIATAFGYSTSEGTSWRNDTLGACIGSNINKENLNNISLNSTPSGYLLGISSNEQINYSVSIPSNSIIWNTTNKLNIVSTGEQQTIPMKANIKKADNPSYRMTPDTYQSTLTILLTY